MTRVFNRVGYPPAAKAENKLATAPYKSGGQRRKTSTAQRPSPDDLPDCIRARASCTSTGVKGGTSAPSNRAASAGWSGEEEPVPNYERKWAVKASNEGPSSGARKRKKDQKTEG